MEFSRIWYDGATVELKWETPLAGGIDKHEWPCSEKPAPRFAQALQAFVPFVVELLGLPDTWAEDLVVRSLALKRDEKIGRGFQVTVLRKIADAKNRSVTITTPYMTEAPESSAGDGTGYLDDIVLQLIEQVEDAAAAYRDGERGEQTTLFPPTSPTVAEFNDRAAAAEAAQTRKPRGKKKGKDFVPGVGDVANPDATAAPTDAMLRTLLLRVRRDVPIKEIAGWNSSERDLAQRWADALLDPLRKAEFIPAEPLCVHAAATLPLAPSAEVDGWTDPAPVRVDDDAQQEIQAAAERG